MSYVVIGGGLAGISAALTLQEAGETVELFEASDDLGGRVRSDFVDGFILDRGFQLINAGYSEIKRLGVIDEIEFCKADRTVDVVTPFGTLAIGDPRLHPLQAVRSPLGSIRQKISRLTFLAGAANGEISLRDALLAAGAGDFYDNVLRPFLLGVFLSDPTQIDSAYGQEIIRSFIVGDSGLPSAGVGALTQALGARVENVRLSSPITSLSQCEGAKIIIATDSNTAAQLLNRDNSYKSVGSVTWYHSIPAGVINSKRLRVTSVESPIVNSLAISNIVSGYAPADRTLISTTTLAKVSESEIALEIAKFWNLSPNELSIVGRYEIADSLPLFSPGDRGVQSAQVGSDIYLAGDYLSAGSQNGALLSGRLAALEALTH